MLDRRRAGVARLPNPSQQLQQQGAFSSLCQSVSARLGDALGDIDTPALLVDLDGELQLISDGQSLAERLQIA